jgi:hypothetical protein
MIWAAIMAGLTAGLVHVLLGPDHLAAVAPFAIGKRARGWHPGLQWGLGHCAGVLLMGLLALMFKDLFPIDFISSSAETLVGVLLIGVGAWGICKSFAYPKAELAKAPLALGAVHGLAGSSHLLGVIPGLLFPGPAAVCAYLVAFGAGTIIAMVLFSLGLAALPNRIHRTAIIGSSAFAVVIGGYWLIA